MKKIVTFCFLLFVLQNESDVLAASQISYKIEMLPWNEADLLLPKYAKFTVLDIETGRQFRVQRRAGSQHADVQPLTVKDTETMKRIYGGKWSWKRRAIIIIYKDQWIAASMHGMPHGAGVLKNNFPGHFCIHFYGCKTHRTNTMDLAHMLMIFKASGTLDAYLERANPYEVINAYITGIQQEDVKIVSKVSLQNLNWGPVFKQIEGIKITQLPQLPPEDLKGEIQLDIPIEIDWYIKNTGRQTFKGEMHLLRFSHYDSWKIDSIHFLKQNNIIHKEEVLFSPVLFMNSVNKAQLLSFTAVIKKGCPIKGVYR